jgi:MarR family transcriptional regulator, lower aerobic nicotinate degradation pathway regulator
MNTAVSPKSRRKTPSAQPYILEEQIGFVLRCASQRHTTIFAEQIGGELTPTQWTAMVKLADVGPCSQNQLGRITAVDVATIKGVIDRLTARGLTRTMMDPEDGRRLVVSLTSAGHLAVQRTLPNAVAITEQTLNPLTAKERETLLMLLSKIT